MNNPQPTAYSITPDQAASISAPERAFGTTRLLPSPDQIPAHFLSGRESSYARPYRLLVDALFYGDPLPQGNMEFINGHEQNSVVQCVQAHLASWEPKHEHKMAGVAYMLSLMATLELTDAN